MRKNNEHEHDSYSAISSNSETWKQFFESFAEISKKNKQFWKVLFWMIQVDTDSQIAQKVPITEFYDKKFK